MLEIYSYPATRGLRCTWAAEELGLEYNFNVVNLYKGEHKSKEYLKITPTGKVPAITYEGITIAESGAILTYLGDVSGKLIPSVGTTARAEFEQAMYFVLTELEQPLWTIGKHTFALPEEHRVPDVVASASWEFQKALSIFSQMLGDKPYLLGDEFSLVDIAAGHTLSWAKGSQQDIPQGNIKAYAKRVLSRDALARAKALEVSKKP